MLQWRAPHPEVYGQSDWWASKRKRKQEDPKLGLREAGLDLADLLGKRPEYGQGIMYEF